MRFWLALLLLPLSGCFGGSGFLGLGPADPVYDGPWPEPDAADIRPGMPVLINRGDTASACTSNFLFRTADNKTLYLGVAGHCVGEGDDELGHKVFLRQETGDPREIGTIGFSAYTGDASTDFALIKLYNRESVRAGVSPEVRHWGGPTGTFAGSASPGDAIVTYGATPQRAYNDPDNPRQGRVFQQDGNIIRFWTDHPSIPGDSGSPALSATGEALCVVTTQTTVNLPVPLFPPQDEPSLNSCVALQPMLTKARAAIPGLELVPGGAFAAPAPVPGE